MTAKDVVCMCGHDVAQHTVTKHGRPNGCADCRCDYFEHPEADLYAPLSSSPPAAIDLDAVERTAHGWLREDQIAALVTELRAARETIREQAAIIETMRMVELQSGWTALPSEKHAALVAIAEAAKGVRRAIDAKSISIQFDSTDSIERLLTTLRALEAK